MKIGIYDSGIGGLSVLHQARKMLPDAEFLYYADEKHVPYGEKTREEIKGYVEEILNFLIDHGVDAVVIACNTATSVAKKEFRNTFSVPIVGMEPAVKKAVRMQQDVVDYAILGNRSRVVVHREVVAAIEHALIDPSGRKEQEFFPLVGRQHAVPVTAEFDVSPSSGVL